MTVNEARDYEIRDDGIHRKVRYYNEMTGDYTEYWTRINSEEWRAVIFNKACNDSN